MLENEQDEIFKKVKQKYILPKSTQIFYFAVIILLCFFAGLVSFKFQTFPTDVKPQNIELLRRGLSFSFVGAIAYLLWIFWRSFQMQKEFQSEVAKAAIKSLNK